jgi:phage/plasmid primase-like uncharacterized protein
MLQTMPDIEYAFKNFLNSINHAYCDEIQFDTQNWQRFDCPTSPKGNKNVSYKAHSDKYPCLKIKCHKCHSETIVFKYEGHPQFTNSQYQKMFSQAKKRNHDQKKQSYLSLKEMRSEWDSAPPCLGHCYFQYKDLSITEADGLRINKSGCILCPIRLISGELISTQSIPFKGKKKFYTGLSKKKRLSCFWLH